MASEVFRKHKPAILLTFGMFALWGVGHQLYNTLVPEFAKTFELNSVELVVTQNVYSFVYFLFAIPAAIYARTFGCKAGLVFGLGAWCVGAFLFYPAAEQHAFLFFLFAAAVLCCGYIFIEIAVNPVVARMGPPESAIRRLNFAHALYPVGVLAGLYIGRWVILSDLALPLEKLASAVVRPYMVIGAIVLALAFLVDKTEFPALATERSRDRGALQEFRTLLSRPLFVAAIAAQFCGVAARAGTWVLSGSYIKEAIPGSTALIAADYLLVSLILYGVGRVTGAILMFWFNPGRLLAIFAASGLVLAGVATVYGGEIGVYAMVASSLSMSITYATILGTAIRDLGPLTKAGTALVYIGGAGSAIGVALMHVVWTFSSIQFAMIVPMIGYTGVLVFALMSHRTDAARRTTTVAHAAE